MPLAVTRSTCVCLTPWHPLDNPLQTAVLNLFVSIKWRFPNLVVGAITRESVRKALVNGITADQVRPIILSCPNALCNGVPLLLGPITWPRPEGNTNNRSAIRLLATSLPMRIHRCAKM
jgi:hypothetical protein